MKYLKHFANSQEAEDFLDNFDGDYNFLASVEGSSVVGIIEGVSGEPAPDEIWYMSKSGDPLNNDYFTYYFDDNHERLSILSHTLVGDHYVIKFSDDIYWIEQVYDAGGYNFSWIFIPSTVSQIIPWACYDVDEVRYNGDRSVSPGSGYPWNQRPK